MRFTYIVDEKVSGRYGITKKDYKVAAAGTGARDIIRGCHNRGYGREWKAPLPEVHIFLPEEWTIDLSVWQKCRAGRNLDHEGGVTASGQVYEPIRSLCWPRDWWRNWVGLWERFMSKKLAIAMFGQKRLSREGGVEIVVKELCTRMARDGCDVTCYNRAGHHVSGAWRCW